MRQSASSINYQLGSLYSVITAFLYATQEPFSFPAAKHFNTLQFVALTQVSLLVSLPLLLSRSTSRRDFTALLRKPINYGYLAVIFAIGLTGLLLYNFGLSNAHPIIISAILNLSPFWAALVALVLAGVPIPISRATFFGRRCHWSRSSAPKRLARCSSACSVLSAACICVGLAYAL